MFLKKIVSSQVSAPVAVAPGAITIVLPADSGDIPAMGTSGLRKPQEWWTDACLIKFMVGVITHFKKQRAATQKNTIIVGGDPRKGNISRRNIIIRLLRAEGFEVITTKGGIISTPAASVMITQQEALGAVILTASHNPATDWGIKINGADGKGAPTDVTERIAGYQNAAKDYVMREDLDLSWIDAGTDALELDGVKRVSAATIYADHLDAFIGFKQLKKILSQKPDFMIALDAKHGAAYPFLQEIFEGRLGLVEGTNLRYLNKEPREDLGGDGVHPEPDFAFIQDLIAISNGYTLCCAYDSDVDRRLNGGNGFWLESADEFAIISMHLHLFPELLKEMTTHGKTINLGRSLVTADTITLIIAALNEKHAGIRFVLQETPTGFKYISALGNWGVEESNGMGWPGHGEKDGIAASLMLLKIMLLTGKTAQKLQEKHWAVFGRTYFSRGEISDKDGTKADQETLTKMFNELVNDASLGRDQPDRQFVGKKFGGLTLISVEKSPTLQGTDPKTWIFRFSDGNVIKARFSGTGSGGYCLRVYATKASQQYNEVKTTFLAPLKGAFNHLIETALKSFLVNNAQRIDEVKKLTNLMYTESNLTKMGILAHLDQYENSMTYYTQLQKLQAVPGDPPKVREITLMALIKEAGIACQTKQWTDESQPDPYELEEVD